MSFADDLKAATEAPKPFEDVPIALNGKSYTLRFTEMDPLEWADCCDRAPARPGVLLDTHFGYNLRVLTKIAAPLSGKRVDGDSVEPLSEDEWRYVFKVSGGMFQQITDALMMLNHIAPLKAVEEAKKASRGEPELSSD